MPTLSYAEWGAEDRGRPNQAPAVLAKAPAPTASSHEVSNRTRWWHNTHHLNPAPLGFSDRPARFSAPGLPRSVLYLATDAIACFWECGLGLDLRDRFENDRTLTRAALESRHEYSLSLDCSRLRLFDSRRPESRRAIGAKTVACFTADYAIARGWAALLMTSAARIDGILYESVRQGPAVCLALFDTPDGRDALPKPRPKALRSSWENPELLASLLLENTLLQA